MRVFTFGCSFTQFQWPTWADLILSQYDGENWGQCGGGNKFIFESLIECSIRNSITKDDTVIIMWSSFTREDRHINGAWQTTGNVYNSEPLYDTKFLKRYWDDEGALINNFNLISATMHVLSNIGCNWKMATMIPFGIADRANTPLTKNPERFNEYNKFINQYTEHFLSPMSLDSFYRSHSSFQDLVSKVKDNHPTPNIHAEWLSATSPLPLDYNKINHDGKAATEFLLARSPFKWDKNKAGSYYDPRIPVKLPHRRF